MYSNPFATGDATAVANVVSEISCEMTAPGYWGCAAKQMEGEICPTEEMNIIKQEKPPA